jgi:beta-glucosidase
VAAREELLSECGKCDIGISQNAMSFAPDRPWHPLDHALVRFASWNYNHTFLAALSGGQLRIQMPGIGSVKETIPGGKDAMDFIGMNYYTRAHLRFVWTKPPIEFIYRDPLKRGLTHIGWEDYPEGFGQALSEMKRYGLPVWITENGIDDPSGERRPHYLHAHWKELLRQMGRGVDVRGYLHWSLLDNFEWLEGWGPRFGLYHVDFETLERRPTPACHYFRQTATQRVLLPPAEPATH